MSRKTVLVLGPSFDNHMEPMPVDVTSPSPVAGPGRRQLTFQDTPTSPGGHVHLALLPPVHPEDAMPIVVYAFACHEDFGPKVPDQPDRKPEWFFTSGHPSSSARIGEADEKGQFTITIPNVKPSLKPHFIQTVVEFSA